MSIKTLGGYNTIWYSGRLQSCEESVSFVIVASLDSHTKGRK